MRRHACGEPAEWRPIFDACQRRKERKRSNRLRAELAVVGFLMLAFFAAMAFGMWQGVMLP